MNNAYMYSLTTGRGQVKGIAQTDKGVELHIITHLGKSGSGVEAHLYAVLEGQQCKVLSEHLSELARNKPLAMNYQAEVVGVRPNPAGTGDKEKSTQALHLNIVLAEFSVEPMTGCW